MTATGEYIIVYYDDETDPCGPFWCSRASGDSLEDSIPLEATDSASAVAEAAELNGVPASMVIVQGKR